jgi:transcriptional/translational regulatory protein YebC/TACO1
VHLSGADAERMLKLFDALEEHDDVQNAYSNFEVSDEEMARLT